MDPAPRQLDIFADSRDVMLRNDVLHALQAGDAAAARAAWSAVAHEYPGDEGLGALELLISALELPNPPPPADDPAALGALAALGAEADQLAGPVTAAALRFFGEAAGRAWMRPRWHALARRAAGLPFVAEHAEVHAAALWLRGGDWAGAEAAVERIESWRRIPAPLAWMLEARCRLAGLDGAWPLLAELAWLAPARLEALIPRLGEALLIRLHKRFGASFEGAGEPEDLAWFPAWVLTETPALARLLAQATPALQRPPEQGMRRMLELLGLERQGRHHDVVRVRRVLRDLHPGLYAACMASR